MCSQELRVFTVLRLLSSYSLNLFECLQRSTFCFNYQRKRNLYFFIRAGFHVISFATNILLIYMITPFLKILIITGYAKVKTNVAVLPIMPVEVKFGDPQMTVV